MANQPPLKDSPTEWPTLGVGAASQPPPRSRKWSRPPGVEGGDAHEPKLGEAKEESLNVDLPMEKTGPDQKVVMGFAGQWGALENARFVPKQGDRRKLMYDIKSLRIATSAHCMSG